MRHVHQERTGWQLDCWALRCIRLAIVVLILNVVSSVLAQEYATLPIDDKAKANRVIAQQCLRDPGAYAANKAKFDDFFNKFYFPAMTQATPESLREMGDRRSDFFKNFMLKTNNAQLQLDLTDIAFNQMARILGAKNPPCHPAVRYNAILLIGMLDEQYSPDGKQPPKPYPKATQALTTVVGTATVDNRFPPAVILGALIGLERHAQLRAALPPESVSAMQAALIKLVTREQPIQEVDTDAYSWIRLRAASALARLGTVGEKNVASDAIVKLAATANSLDDRCAALALLGKLNYKDAKLDDANTSEPIFALARDLAATEDKRAADFQDKNATGGFAPAAPFPGPESFSPGGVTFTDPNAFQRRPTLARLTDFRSGVEAVKPGLPAESQKKADLLLAAINPVIVAASKDTVDLKLVEAIRTMAQAINTAVPGAAKAEDDKAKEDAVF